jgi:hypothetical protein
MYMYAMGMVHFAPYMRKYLILRAEARTRQQRPVPLSPWANFLFLIPFLCVVNVYETEIAALGSNVQVYVLEPDRCIIAGVASIIILSQYEEECDGDHIRDSLCVIVS